MMEPLLFYGFPKKQATHFIVLSAMGWLVLVCAFGVRRQKSIDELDEVERFPFWIALSSGPVIFILAFLHAALWKPLSSLLQAATALLSMTYIVALGGVIYMDAIAIRVAHQFQERFGLDPDPEYTYVVVELSGAVFSAIFWGLLGILWPFYTDKGDLHGQHFPKLSITVHL